MTRFRHAALTLALLTLAGCGGGPPAAPAAPAAPSAAPSPVADEAPALVVLLVLDQLGAWVLDAHLPHLPEDGLLRWASDRGASHVGDYPYAATETAPGHATLATGVSPAVHGVAANDDLVAGRRRGSVDDGASAVIDAPGRFAGPGRLAVPTVGDLLDRATRGEAKVATLSFKDRSAVLTAGHAADLALFFDARAGAFTTSTAYAPSGALPDWLARYQGARPTASLLGPWLPDDPARLEERFGPDDAPGEASCFEGRPAFPYDARTAPHPFDAHLCTPTASEQLLDLALAAVEELALGRDAVPDLLVVSLSGPDYVGHAHGPESWEYADHLRRADRALRLFADALAARGPVAFVLTADHGVLPLPERLATSERPAGRIPWSVLEEAVRRVPGAEAVFEGVLPPFVYLRDDVPTPPALRDALRAALAEVPHVAAVYDARRAAELRRSVDPLERRVGESLPAAHPGDFYLVAEPRFFFELPGLGAHGTHHGSPYDYDRQVPIRMWGAGVTRVVTDEPVDMRRVATTLAALLGIAPPPGAPTEPLPGVLPR